MRRVSNTFWLRVSGELACWTPPEFRVERMSALLPSHAAWVGLLKTVLGKWEFRWRVSSARVLFEPSYLSITSNELKALPKSYETAPTSLLSRSRNPRRSFVLPSR